MYSHYVNNTAFGDVLASSSNSTKLNQIMFEQELFENKCSSYIDNQKNFILGKMILNSEQIISCSNSQATNTPKNQREGLGDANRTVKAVKPGSTTKKSIKKFRQAISNKLKKLITLNQSPDAFNFFTINNDNTTNVVNKKPNLAKKRKSLTKTSHPTDSSIKLVNFNFEQNFINLETSVNRSVKSPRTMRRRNSTGGSSFSSSSSSSSLDSNNFLFATPQLNYRNPSSCNNLLDSQFLQTTYAVNSRYCTRSYNNFKQQTSADKIETSTPVCRDRVRPAQHAYSESSIICMSQFEINQQFEAMQNEEQTEEVNIALLMDQSTQAMVDSPVLVESTFNTSSLSNLSDDLIILQTARPRYSQPPLINSTRNSALKKTPKTRLNSTSKKSANRQRKSLPRINSSSNRSWTDQVMDKFQNDTFTQFDQVPTWANGYELNMALVNQLYFNPNANGVFGGSILVNRPSTMI